MKPTGVPDADRARRSRFPEWVEPMLAVLSKEVFSHPDWIYEAKLDGQRSLVFKKGSDVRLMTRNRKDRTSHYPDLRAALLEHDEDFVADGEIVAFDGDRTSFSRLQDRMQNAAPTRSHLSATPVYFYLFDLVWWQGYDLSSLSLTSRKALLRSSLTFADPLRFSDHLEQEGEIAYREACKKRWEGLIAKRGAASYNSGRSRDWLKFKCVLEQEFVIVGWTDPHGSRSGLGALLVGYHDEHGDLRYAGKVGTGYNAKTLRTLSEKLAPLERPEPSVVPEKGLPKKGVHWVAPKHVAQVGFSEWTDDARLRHPRYVGLRDDKDPSQIVREQV